MRKSIKAIKYTVIGGIFLVPFIPLVVTKSMFFPFITGKNFLFRILIELLAGLWLVLAIYDKKYLPKFTSQRNWILYFFIAFVAVLILATIFGANPYRSFWSNFERMEGLVAYLHLLAYFLILVSVLRTEKLWKLFFNVSLAASMIAAVYGVLQLSGIAQIHQSDVRLDSTLGNASYLAIYMVFHVFLALWFLLKTQKWHRWFYIPVIVLESLILYHTATRGAILGLVGGLLLAALLIGFLSQSKKIKIIAAGSLCLIVLAVGSFWMLRTSDFIKHSPVLSRFASISLQDGTTKARFVIWKMSWEGFKEKPILGWGPENYNLVFNKYYEPVLYEQEPWFDRAHNVFFDKLTTSGILGLLAYVGLFGAALFYLLFKRKQCGFASYDSGVLVGLLAAYFFHNIFVFDNLASSMLFVAVLAYTHSRCANAEKQEIESPVGDSISKDDYKRPAIASAAIIVILFLIYFLNVPAILTARNLLSAIQEDARGNTESAEQKYEKALSYESFGSSETREHLTQFAGKVLAAANVDNDLKSKVFNLALSEMKNQIQDSPNDIRYIIFEAVLFNNAKQYDEAIKILEQAVALSPKKQQIYFELGTSYLNKKDYESAEKVLKTAYELEPNWDEAREIYAVALVFNGKEKEAENLLSERFGAWLIADSRLAKAYANSGNFAKASQIWEKLVEASPGNLQYRVVLAATYLEIGQREKAIEQLQKAIEIEPRFKEQGEYYINEIRSGRNP